MSLSNSVSVLIIKLIPRCLHNAVLCSFDVPQIGPYHKEGSTLSKHIALMFQVADTLLDGKTVGELPEDIAAFIIDETPMFDCDDLVRFILLHDIGKTDKMQMTVGDQTTDITLKGWKEFNDDQQAAVEKISYIGHDERSGEMLSQADFDHPLVAKTVACHMRAVSGFEDMVNIPLFEEVFESWTDREIVFMILTRYLDQAGSLSEDGTPDLSGVTWLYRSWQAYVAHKELSERLAATERLNKHELSHTLAKLRKADDAFLSESVDEAYDRIVAECVLPEVTEQQVRDALAEAVAQGLSDDLVKAIVSEMTTTGKISRETGKQLGRFNRIVRPALANLG